MAKTRRPHKSGDPGDPSGPPQLDYAALFAAVPSPHVVLDPDLVIVEANRAYLEELRRSRDEVVGRNLFDVLPADPADPRAEGVRRLRTSLRQVLVTRQPEATAVQRYDVPAAHRPGAFEERWWSAVITPVLGPDGSIAWIILRAENVTAFVRSRHLHPFRLFIRLCLGRRSGRRKAGQEAMEAELYNRARQLQQLNEELREAHARERQVAVALQEAMLHAPDLDHHPDIALRYLPAVGSLNVCGDWYDVVDLPAGRYAVAVGDVVGHGLEAAAVMGMLRSALSAATRAVDRPAQALEALDLYAQSVDGALATTAACALIDTRSHHIAYSSAGHLPPILLHTDGTSRLLDAATDPPLATFPRHAPRPQADLSYTPGDTLVLYTDGLIERRGETLDTGLTRLTRALAPNARLAPQHLADTLLDRLGATSGTGDDIALIIARL